MALLDLVVVEERSRFRTLCQVPRLFTGAPRASRVAPSSGFKT